MIDEKHAFPHPKSVLVETETGMTLRDYMAGQALVTLASADWPVEDVFKTLAEGAYCMADAMMIEREKKNR